MPSPQITNQNMPWVTVYEQVRDEYSIIKVQHEIEAVVTQPVPLHAESEDPRRAGVTLTAPDAKYARLVMSGTVDDLEEYIDELRAVLAYARESEAALTARTEDERQDV